MGVDAGNIGLLKRVCVAHGTPQAIGSVIGKNMSEAWAFDLRKVIKFQERHMATTSCSQDRQNE